MFASRRIAFLLSLLVATSSALLQKPQRLSTGKTYRTIKIMYTVQEDILPFAVQKRRRPTRISVHALISH